MDLAPLVDDHSEDYLPWKWELGKAPDGRLTGLPTDVGSLAVCHHKDLFEAAGPPTDRDEVSALWPDWDSFLRTGRTYQEGQRDTAARFADYAALVAGALGDRVRYWTSGDRRGCPTAWLFCLVVAGQL